MHYFVRFMLVLAGAAFLWAVVSHLSLVRRRRTMEAKSATWPSVTGRVIASSATEVDVDDISYCSPHVLYEYVVGGARYTSDRLSFGVTDLKDISREAVQGYVDALFPAGADVTVYYDPDMPDSAVFDRTPERQPPRSSRPDPADAGRRFPRSPVWVDWLLAAAQAAVHWSAAGDPRASDRVVLGWAAQHGHANEPPGAFQPRRAEASATESRIGIRKSGFRPPDATIGPHVAPAIARRFP